MNDIRRTILWVIFGFSLVLIWDKWQLHNGKQATFFPGPAPVVTASAPTGRLSTRLAILTGKWASSAPLAARWTLSTAPEFS